MKKVWSCLLTLTIVLLSATTLVLPAVADVPSYVAGIENGFGYINCRVSARQCAIL